jgi:5-methylcytosine-specific restriction enzyme subunit McrC
MDLRTIRLVEYRPRAVRLLRADANFLLANARHAVEIVPTGELRQYRLTAQGVAGVVLTPNLWIAIRPKIPRANLFHLLNPDSPPELLPDRSAAEPGTDAIDFLAGRLAAGMSERAARGFDHSYVEESGRQQFLQGRLNIAAQLRQSPTTRDHFHVTRQEFSPDSLLNRLPKSVAEAITASPFISPQTRAALRAAIAGYDSVQSVPLNIADFDHIVFDQFTELERPFLDLCRLLAESIQPTDKSGDTSRPGFLINLERVFEKYVERVLRVHIPGIETQREFVFHRPTRDRQPALTGRPDIVIRSNGKPKCVIDAKWKSLDGPPPAADVHQALAYAIGLGCKDVRLVYPGGRWSTWRYEMAQSDVSLTIHALRVVGPREKCEQSMRRLVKSVG